MRKPSLKYLSAVEKIISFGGTVAPDAPPSVLYDALDGLKYHWNGQEWHLRPNARPRTPESVSVRLQASDPTIANALATIVAGALEDNGLTVVDRTAPQELCSGTARVHLELKV